MKRFYKIFKKLMLFLTLNRLSLTRFRKIRSLFMVRQHYKDEEAWLAIKRIVSSYQFCWCDLGRSGRQSNANSCVMVGYAGLGAGRDNAALITSFLQRNNSSSCNVALLLANACILLFELSGR